MSRATQQMRDIAARLMAMEAAQSDAAGTDDSAAYRVCQKLRPHLAPLMGATGFHALLSRALTLARAEVPRLSSVQVTADGSLTRPDKSGAQLKPEDLAEGGCAIVAQLLSLLEAFVGERLTLRMLLAVWPKLQMHDHLLNQDQNEKANHSGQTPFIPDSHQASGQSRDPPTAERGARSR